MPRGMYAGVTWTPGWGQRLTFDQQSVVLESIDDVGGPPVEMQMQRAPFQDGATWLGSTLEPREMMLKLTLVADSRAALMDLRRQLVVAFDPKAGPGVLRWPRDDGTYEIQAVPSRPPHFATGRQGQGQTWVRALLGLTCPNPFWLKQGTEAVELAAFEGGLTFPLQLPTTFAEQSEGKEKIIMNAGDAETPLEITFHGPATAPLRVTNETTGEYIEVAQDLLAGEKLVINTEFGRKSVTKIASNSDESNAFHYINLSSTFFNLVAGNNLLSYSTGDPFEQAPVGLLWRERYLGV